VLGRLMSVVEMPSADGANTPKTGTDTGIAANARSATPHVALHMRWRVDDSGEDVGVGSTTAVTNVCGGRYDFSMTGDTSLSCVRVRKGTKNRQKKRSKNGLRA